MGCACRIAEQLSPPSSHAAATSAHADGTTAWQPCLLATICHADAALHAFVSPLTPTSPAPLTDAIATLPLATTHAPAASAARPCTSSQFSRIPEHTTGQAPIIEILGILGEVLLGIDSHLHYNECL